jgi:hypothetical protein
LIFSFMTFVSTAQLNLEFQGKGLFNSSWIVSKSISDQGNSQDYDLAWASNYGVAVNLWLGKIGFGVEGIFGKHNAAYTGTVEIAGVGLSYNSKVALSTSAIPLLFKVRGQKAGYFELGVQMNSISSATYSMEGDLASIYPHPSDIMNRYNKSYLSAVMGFGANIKPFENFPLGILIGARFQYGYKDMKGVDALGNRLDNTLFYDPYNSAHAISGGIMVGLTYTLGKTKQ